MSSRRRVNELAAGLEAFHAVPPLLAGNPGLVASAVLASVVLLGRSWATDTMPVSAQALRLLRT